MCASCSLELERSWEDWLELLMRFPGNGRTGAIQQVTK